MRELRLIKLEINLDRPEPSDKFAMKETGEPSWLATISFCNDRLRTKELYLSIDSLFSDLLSFAECRLLKFAWPWYQIGPFSSGKKVPINLKH